MKNLLFYNPLQKCPLGLKCFLLHSAQWICFSVLIYLNMKHLFLFKYYTSKIFTDSKCVPVSTWQRHFFLLYQNNLKEALFTKILLESVPCIYDPFLLILKVLEHKAHGLKKLSGVQSRDTCPE